MLSMKPILRIPDAEDRGAEGVHLARFPNCTYKGSIKSGFSEVWYEKLDEHTPSESFLRHPLPACLDVYSHSKAGFDWGYGGSGPAQLALALLVHALDDDGLALAYYQFFKREHVAKWSEEWSITASAIRKFIVECPQSPLSILFSLGRIVATPAALRTVTQDEMFHSLSRHQQGDWGELERHDWNANDNALKRGSRLLSAYDSIRGERYLIITEEDRSSTTVLLPSDY